MAGSKTLRGAGSKTLRGQCKNQPESKYSSQVTHLEGAERRKELQKVYESNRPKRSREYKPRKKDACQKESKQMVKSKTGCKRDGSKKVLHHRKHHGEITTKVGPGPHDLVPLGKGSGQQGAPCDELTGQNAEAFGPLSLDPSDSSKPESHDLQMSTRSSEVSPKEENLCLLPPGFIEDDSEAEFYCPWRNGADAKEKEKEKDDQSELIADLRSELSLVRRKLRWHEEVRDWISAVGRDYAAHLIARGMAPEYLRFSGALFSGTETSC